jgi:GTPase SAR1 family protein
MRRQGSRHGGVQAPKEEPLVPAPRIGTEEYKARLREAAAKGIQTMATPPKGRGRAGEGAAGPARANSDRHYKVVVVGDSGVGKTALLLRFVCDSYYDAGVSGTIGGTFLAKSLDVDGAGVNLKIWDTAGQERFRSVIRMYYRGAGAAILCCDLGDEASCTSLQAWADEVRLVCGASVLFEVVE